MFFYLLVIVFLDLFEVKLKLLLIDDFIGLGVSEKYCLFFIKRNMMLMLN